VDSGTTISLFPVSTAQNLSLPVVASDEPISVEYGNGSMSSVDKQCPIGRKHALIDVNTNAPLVSTNDLVGGSNEVHITTDTAGVTNSVLGRDMPFHKSDDGLSWLISITDMAEVTQWPYDEALGHRTSIDGNVRRMLPFSLLNKAKQLERIVSLHERMGHPPINIMIKAIRQGQWLNTGIEWQSMAKLWQNHKCVACTMGKSNVVPQSEATDVRTTVTGAEISTDPVPVDIPGVDGETWVHFFKDVATGHWNGKTSDTKADFPQALREVLTFYKAQGHKTSVVRSDSEYVLQSAEVKAVLDEFGCTAQHTTPYQHQQNTVERDVQTLVKQVCTILHGQTMLKAGFWTYALNHAIACHNRTPNGATHDETPRSKVMQYDGLKKTNFANTFNFKFGELVAVGVKKEQRKWKFDTKREVAIYVGQPAGTVDGHLVYFPWEGNILVRGDVIRLDIPPEKMAEYYAVKYGIKEGKSSYKNLVEVVTAMGMNSDEFVGVDSHPNPVPLERVFAKEKMGTRNRPVASEPAPTSSSLASTSHHVDVDVRKPRELLHHLAQQRKLDFSTQCQEPVYSPIEQKAIDFAASKNPDLEQVTLDEKFAKEFATHSCATRVHGPNNPTVSQAVKTPDQHNWEEALRSEVQKNLFDTGTLRKVDKLPPGALLSWITFVLKRKIKQDREDRFKARGCYRGDLLDKGYTETYSPTVATMTCAVLQNIAVIDDMEQCLVDTVGAFLQQDYPDTQPALYVKLDKRVAEICGLDPNQIYRVHKYLYGIPDAGRAYYLRYSGLLRDKGYKQSKFDPCLFHSQPTPDTRLWAWIHVDDTWVAATTPELKHKFIQDCSSTFEVTVEPADNYLGVHYEKLPNGSVKKTQKKLLEELFIKHEITDQPRVKTPATQTPDNGFVDTTVFPVVRYLSLLGSLLYLLMSRPDIGFAVSFGATKAHAPTESDWRALKKVLQYLFQTKDKGLIIEKQPKNCPLQMHIMVDASYLLYRDSKAQTGYSFSLNGIGTFFSKSQKQALVTTSSSHSETRALFTSVTDYVLVEHICDEVGRPLTAPAICYEDNQPVVTLMNRDAALPKASKHFIMLINYCREMIASGLISVEKISTWENFADILTKHVYGADYAYKSQCMLGVQEDEVVLTPVGPKSSKSSTAMDEC